MITQTSTANFDFKGTIRQNKLNCNCNNRIILSAILVCFVFFTISCFLSAVFLLPSLFPVSSVYFLGNTVFHVSSCFLSIHFFFHGFRLWWASQVLSVDFRKFCWEVFQLRTVVWVGNSSWYIVPLATRK